MPDLYDKLSGMKLKIKRSEDVQDLPTPTYGRSGDAAFDIVASETVTIDSKSRYGVGTGLHLEIPDGHVGLVWDRSGLAFKSGITCLGGVIDSNYRGEVKVCLLNTSDEPVKIERGDRIAQMVIQPVLNMEIEEVGELSDTSRGEAGFGSSGK